MFLHTIADTLGAFHRNLFATIRMTARMERMRDIVLIWITHWIAGKVFFNISLFPRQHFSLLAFFLSVTVNIIDLENDQVEWNGKQVALKKRII